MPRKGGWRACFASRGLECFSCPTPSDHTYFQRHDHVLRKDWLCCPSHATIAYVTKRSALQRDASDLARVGLLRPRCRFFGYLESWRPRDQWLNL